MGKARGAGRAHGDAGTTERAPVDEVAPSASSLADAQRRRDRARRDPATATATDSAAGAATPQNRAASRSAAGRTVAAPAPATPDAPADRPRSGQTAPELAGPLAVSAADAPAATAPALVAAARDALAAAPTAALADALADAPAPAPEGLAPQATSLQGLQAQIEALERRLERGLRFVHVVADRNQRAIGGHAALLHGLGDALTRAGAVVPAEVAAARDGYLAAAPAPEFRIRVAADVDKYAVPAVEIDCEQRLSLCKAACCRRPFALSTQDLEEGVLRWDFADPYVNRRDAGGRCVHATEACRCGVYEQRPLRCRRFDCRQDASIWIDFDRWIPNPELAALPAPHPATAARVDDAAPAAKASER